MSEDNAPLTVSLQYRKNKEALDPYGVTVQIKYTDRPFIRNYPWVKSSKIFIDEAMARENVVDAYVVPDPPDMKEKGYVQ